MSEEFMTAQKQKRASIQTATNAAQILWPDFIEVNDCVFLAFLVGENPSELPQGKTETECFINHMHLFDEFGNRATTENSARYSGDLDVVEEMYDINHRDFIAACDLGLKIARMWAVKLKFDFPRDRFRVYYTQNDNPIVRFHKVRSGEPEWLSDDALRLATDPSFQNAVIYDTGYLDRPTTKRAS